MDTGDKRRLERRARMFKSLAHPVRLYFLEQLRSGPQCVCDLAELAGVPKSAASKHLSQLKEAGLVEDQKKGVRVEYQLIAPCVLDAAVCTEKTALEVQRRRLDD